uniref:Uncharacterized protein n=1 Tax=Hucho hucho TaxID=62062 RepID=A0A4W5NP50_9TELE
MSNMLGASLSQLASVMENLKNIFLGPEMVANTPLMIEQAEMLEGHRKLVNLECSCTISTAWAEINTDIMNLILNYFGKVSDDLAKQLWIVLQRALGKAEGHSEQ